MVAPVWMAFPPEIYSGLLSSGPGAGALSAAAGAWDGLAAEYVSIAEEISELLSTVEGCAWGGVGADRYVTAHAPYLAWLMQAHAAAVEMTARHEAAAAAYSDALAAMPTLAELALNHTMHAVLVATNFFGINSIPIAVNEADYARMWIQAAITMSVYEATSTAAVAGAPKAAAAPSIVRSDAASTPPAPAVDPLQWLHWLLQQLTTTPNEFGLDHLMSQLGLGKLFSDLENFEGANSFFNLILPDDPLTPFPPGTTFEEALSSVWLSFTQGTFVFDPQTLVFAHNPTELIAEVLLFATQLVTHRITDFIQLAFNFPQILGPVVAAMNVPAVGVAGVSGLAGLASPAVAPAVVAPAPIAPEARPLIAVAPALAPAPPAAAAPAAATAVAAPSAPPAPAAPPPVAGAEAFAFPYVVGGPGIGSGSKMSTGVRVGATKDASRPDAAAASAAAAAGRKRQSRGRRRLRRGYGDEYMDMNIEVEPDWGAALRGRPATTAASERGAETLGFAGAAGRTDIGVTGLATLVEDSTGGGPTAPMTPSSWDPEP